MNHELAPCPFSKGYFLPRERQVSFQAKKERYDEHIPPIVYVGRRQPVLPLCAHTCTFIICLV